MLLNTELKIKVTNDGKNNRTETTSGLNPTIAELFVTIELAKISIQNLFEIYLKAKYGKVSSEQFQCIYNTITMDELFNSIKENTKS